MSFALIRTTIPDSGTGALSNQFKGITFAKYEVTVKRKKKTKKKKKNSGQESSLTLPSNGHMTKSNLWTLKIPWKLNFIKN